MSMSETLMEMYYFPAIRDFLASEFGVRVLRILKPSQRREGWVGFDQGWVRTDLSDEELYNQLSKTLHGVAASKPLFYFGFFLQFKTVDIMKRRSKHTPPGMVADYYRSELDLTRSLESGSIQHHLLVRLSSISGARVAYACPMFFDIDSIYDPPDLSTLRCMPVTNDTPLYNEGERHFIAVQFPKSPSGYWCSEPIHVKSISFAQWITDHNLPLMFMDGKRLSSLIKSAREICWEDRSFGENERDHPGSLLPQAFTIMEVAKDAER